MNYYSKSPTDLKTKNIEVTSIDNYLGFGFRLNIYKGLFFKTNLGIGLVLYGEKNKEEFNNGSSSNYNKPLTANVGKFYPFYSRNSYYDKYALNSGQLIGIFKAGFGWDLYTFKKKID